MAPPRTYSAATAFRTALEEHPKKMSLIDQIDLARLRRQGSFDRLLAKLFHEKQPLWTLKGGYALELSFHAARSTVDIGLTLQQLISSKSGTAETNTVVREMLQRVVGIDLSHGFDRRPDGGARYHVEARMDKCIFSRFHLDLGIGDVVMLPLEVVFCRDWLGFASIETPSVMTISREQRIAEKIHASDV